MHIHPFNTNLLSICYEPGAADGRLADAVVHNNGSYPQVTYSLMEDKDK